MAQKYASVKKKVNKNENYALGDSNCLSCGKHLAYCGKPFSAKIICRSCGAINVYENSQQPKCLKNVA